MTELFESARQIFVVECVGAVQLLAEVLVEELPGVGGDVLARPREIATVRRGQLSRWRPP